MKGTETMFWRGCWFTMESCTASTRMKGTETSTSDAPPPANNSCTASTRMKGTETVFDYHL